jgi:hypothetical protein
VNKKKVLEIIKHALESRGYTEAEANKFLSVITNVKFADKDTPNIFNDFWGSRGPDYQTERLGAAI